MSLFFQWASGIGSLVMLYFMGNKSILGPIFGLITQVFWWGFVITTKSWGLTPAVLGITVLHIRNFIKWRKRSF